LTESTSCPRCRISWITVPVTFSFARNRTARPFMSARGTLAPI
jgi:hypothetical protein